MASAPDSTAVRVAVRIRPLLSQERLQECGECLRRESSTQIILGEQRMFTYDFCFGQKSAQAEMYEQCVEPLLQSFIQGFNSTVMAYGQTGSGKSHTMGTENTGLSRPNEEKGIVPRVIHALFAHINELSNSSLDFNVRCTFLEIYNEELRDLLDPSNRSKVISIRETANGQVVAFGIEERDVSSADELLSCLEDGSVHRSTGSTLMNAHSSRSHAIFSVLLTQRRLVAAAEEDGDREQAEFITSKFTFVDLAGSERLKKTGAEGTRRREGININCGLLALGNVISALGDPNRKSQHVPFRDSKITRLLQDSLGGNSKTLMVACVSPADIHFEETLNTLRYAARARNIVNKPIIGRDPNSQKLEIYRQRIQNLEAALAKLGVDPTRISTLDKPTFARESNTQTEAANEELRNEIMDLRKENSFLDAEVLRLMAVVKNDRRALKEVNEKCCAAVAQKDNAQAVIKSLIEQARSNGPLDADIIARETEHMIQEPQEACLMPFPSDTEADHESGHSSEMDASADSDIEDEVDDLENLKKRRERQFRHQAEHNARSLKRLDADIEHKNALIEQLIRSKQHAELTKQKYEQKIAEMEARVKDTHEERNVVLSKIQESTNSAEQVEAVKNEYQKKIVTMTAQLEELKRKFRENERILRSRSTNENKITALQEDINKVKRQRVALQRQMKEEAEKHRLWVQEHQRQVAALQRQLLKDSVQIGRMNNKLIQQDLVMKAKTERATILQRELTEAKRKIVFSKSKMKSKQHTPVSNNIREAVKKVINSSVQSRELFYQMSRLADQKLHLQDKLKQLTKELALGDHESDAELHESVDTVKTELTFVESKIADIEAQQVKNSRIGNIASSVLPYYVSRDLFGRIGIADDNISALQSLAIYLVNNAIDQRQSRLRAKRREKELEAEILQMQAESETTAARLDLEQRESNRKLIIAEKERERERQALLDIEFDDNSIRKLENQLSRVKRQQSQLLSPIPENGARKSRRRGGTPSASSASVDENNAPFVPKSAQRVRHKSKIKFAKAINYDAVLSSPSNVLTPQASRTMTSNFSEEGGRSVLRRLTDKSRFTGTSRYAGGSSRAKGVETPTESNEHMFKPKQQLPRSPVRSDRREFPDLNLSVMLMHRDRSRPENKLV